MSAEPHGEPPGQAAIIGFGLMGCDIAAIFLAGGWRVTAVEPDRASWPARLDRVAASLGQLGAAAERVTLLDLVATLDDVGFTDVDVVVEAVPERLDLKRAVFAELDRRVPPGVPVATNASGFRITDIAEGCAPRAGWPTCIFPARPSGSGRRGGPGTYRPRGVRPSR